MSFGRERERAGDADALALAAGELVRIAKLACQGERPTRRQQLLDRAPQLGAAGEAVQAQRLGQDLAHGHARIERRVGVLEDDLHVAAERAQRLAIGGAHVASLETDLAGGRLDQAQHQAAGRRLAAAGLADERQRLAGMQVEGQPSTACTAPTARCSTIPLLTGKCLTRLVTCSRGVLMWRFRRRTGSGRAAPSSRRCDGRA